MSPPTALSPQSHREQGENMIAKMIVPAPVASAPVQGDNPGKPPC